MQRIIFLALIIQLFANQKEEDQNGYEGIYHYNLEDRLNIIAQYIPENPIIFEAGAHYGTDTIDFCKKWPQSQIYSFEPNPHAFELFTIATKTYPNVHRHNLALNHFNGQAVLHVCHGTSGDNPIFEGASSLLEASEHMKIHYRGPEVVVPCVVLDDWAAENGIDHIDFMWLDLEGVELQVLASSPRILDTVKAIFVETNFQVFRIGTSLYSELKTFLDRKGFKLVAHWYHPQFQGDAIFVKKEPFEN